MFNEPVNCSITVDGKYLRITPIPKIEDNSVYEIKLYGLKGIDGNGEVADQIVIVYSNLTPSYTNVDAVFGLIGFDKVDIKTVALHIRDASRVVEFVTGKKYAPNQVPFNIYEYVKYKAAYDCLINYCIDMTKMLSNKGTMGDVSYENTIKISDATALAKLLKAEADKWYDSLNGTLYTGPAKPVSVVKSSFIIVKDPTNDIPPSRSYRM